MKEKHNRMVQLAVFLALLALLSGTVHRAAAQSPGLEMRAAAAFEGYFKYGEWLPVWVDLENSGSDLEGEVRVRIQGSTGTNVFAVPVSLPAGSRKRVLVYVLPNNFSREIEIELVSGDSSLASQKVPVQSQPNISYLIGLVSPERDALSLISGIELPGRHRPIILVDLNLDELPERIEGLRSFDVLVFNEVDTSSLTPEQVVVIQSWVNAGGRLVLGGGANYQRTVTAFSDLLPLQLNQVVEVDVEALSPLAEYAGADEIRVPGPFVIAAGEVDDAVLLAGSEEYPLVVEQAAGAGLVNFIALDLSTPPFDGWSGTKNFWQTLLSPGAAYPESLPPDVSPRQMRSESIPYALSNMPVLDLPSVQGLAVLLGIYILLVGPFNYLFLRWRKRLHWAWITIPLITILFSAGSFGIGYLLRGTDVVLNKVALVEMRPDGPAGVTSYLGLFSPGAQDYQIQVEGQGLLSPIQTYYDPWGSGFPSTGNNEMVFVQGDVGEVRGLSVNQWSMQSFMAEETWSDFGQVSADLQLESEHLKGTIRNETGRVIKDAVVIMGRRFVRLGDLAPGAESEIELDLNNLNGERFGPPISYLLFEDQFNSQGPSGPPREAELKRSIIESTFERGSWMTGSPPPSGLGGIQGALLLGWLDEAPPDILIRGREPAQQATALVYQPLSYHYPTSGEVSLAPGMVPGSLVEMPRDGGVCGDTGSTAVYLANGEAVFEFNVPEEIRKMQIEELKLSIWSDGGWWSQPELSLYNWSDESWGSLPAVIQGLNIITNAANLVNDTGLIRVRLNGNDMQGCFFLDMGLDASQSPAGQEG